VPRCGLKPVKRSAGKLPVLQRIIRSELAGHCDQPEHDLIADLGTFVPQTPLRQKRTRPAADQLQQVQSGLVLATMKAPVRFNHFQG
jgi:hypothetical protein